MRIIREDALEGLMTLPDKCCDTCITSPPYYGLRDYDAPGQIGLEPNPKEYIEKLLMYSEKSDEFSKMMEHCGL